jgi:hypothetical protein
MPDQHRVYRQMKALFKSPVVRYCLKFSGSLKLAMLLLAVLIIAAISGTLVESKFDTSVAQQYVYDAPWFIVWLVLLCINLAGAVFVRYPWKSHQLGFVITHAGIIVMLLGAIVGRVWGFEGSITLFKGQDPVNYLLTGLQTFEVRAAGMSKPVERTLNLNRIHPTPGQPEIIKVGNLEVAATGFAAELGLQNRIEKSKQGKPALRLVMNSSMLEKPIERWLFLDDKDNGVLNFGPTVIRYNTQPSEGSEPQRAAEATAPGSRELHFAFARIPQMNTARPVAGPATGMKTSFEFSSENTDKDFKGILKLFIDGQTYSFGFNEVLGREVDIADTGLRLKASKYFADFRMNGKEPASISDEPNNPAVLFEVLGPPGSAAGKTQECAHHTAGATGHAGKDGCCDNEADPGHGKSADPHGGQNDKHNHGTPKPSSELFIYRSPEGYLHFASHTRTKETRGEIRIGEDFSPGFADWVCRVEEVTDSAVVREELAPLSGATTKSVRASGLQVRLTKEAKTHTQWIRMGETTPIVFDGEKLEINFGQKLHPLGFTVQLEKFEVEMNEGTQTPASFKSFVKFHDKENETTLTRAVWMNNPGNFPEFAGAGLLGTAYKFSQSSWNPQNTDETTLQVIRDPGWSFKWMGSLMLCAGLFTMFYLKPYPRFAKAKQTAPVPVRNVPRAPQSSALAPAVEVLVGK